MSTPDENSAAPANDGTSRRVVLRSAGIVGGIAAATAVAGCGSSGGSSSGAGSGSSASGGGAGGSVAKAKVPVGSGFIDADLGAVITQPTTGEFKAFSNVCTHQGCLVTDISGDTIICPCHGSEFSIKNGDAVQGPATKPLAPKTATVKGAEIVVS
ncbi:Rieske (2Fe-2S) protein [Flexivirga caeni]|uniref:Cytochrome bc1 complex Rieske iron-sulfur subunit n=1 Tax=Flexivirga caeni TaxID=2294115 RepID=A0A3M9MHK2_9MICO|nr:Rieske (2Fe-2S) protein [Flexivirga caeni]RNI24627.1 Rieske (2Fe-2S) protein [Flexivirga caeni]